MKIDYKYGAQAWKMKKIDQIWRKNFEKYASIDTKCLKNEKNELKIWKKFVKNLKKNIESAM